MDEFIYKSLPEQTQQLVSKFRHMLREAWRGDPFALQIVQQLAQASARIVVAKNGQLELVIDDLLGTASILFLHDFSAGRLGICANPHCPSPFFVRSRRTQKFCDMPVCMAYSHRVSANNYWARRKEKEQAKSKKRMKNR
jgi:predicted RNA-binding Zn ribbon-like protein